MKYEWLKQRGALQEGHAGTISDSEVLGVLMPHGAGLEPEEQIIVDLRTRRIPRSVLNIVTESIARENGVVPVSSDDETVVFAARDPHNISIADKLRFVLAKDVRLLPAPPSDIEYALQRYYPQLETESVDSMICEFTETAIDFDDSDISGDVGAEPQRRVYNLDDDSMLRSSGPAPEARVVRQRRPALHRSSYRMGYQPESLNGRSGMFYFTVDEGERVLMTDREGRSTVLEGPQRIWKGKNRFESMVPTVAHPGEFLVIRFRDGRQENVSGPAEAWLDRRVHRTIEKQEALQIGANEAIVVYTKEADSDQAARRVETGPKVFVPKPGEWLHTFQWHAAKGGSQGAPKVARGLVFQKLWLMPDQMYHDVPDVRTADDAVLTIRLMIFFELQDAKQMLDTTHDPIGDFVNAATADVVEFTGQHDFESFKQRTHQLNELETYHHLLNRAAQVGYRITNVVYRGYGAPDSLQQMHDQAIEARTRLQLERATEEQAQQLEDFQLESQLARATRRRTEQASEVRHDMELNQEKQLAERKNREAQAQLARELQDRTFEQQAAAKERLNQIQQAHLQALKDLGVNLTEYLTQDRADQVIELRGDGAKPHLHIENGSTPGEHKTNG